MENDRSPSSDATARFIDRAHAAAALIAPLRRLAGSSDLLVVGLAGGGVPIARAIADNLSAPLDVLVARKIGVPGIEHEPLAVMIDGTNRIETAAAASKLGVSDRVLADLRGLNRRDIDRRVGLYRDGHPLADVRDATVLLVDDGISTGLTMRAAARRLRASRPRRIVAVTPVATRSGIAAIRADVDELVVLHIGHDRDALASHYEHFPPLADVDVMRFLGRSVIGRPSLFAGDPRFRIGELGWSGAGADIERCIEIPVGPSTLTADLGMPREEPGAIDDEPRGLVILAHDMDGSREREDTRYVAARLRLAGFATLRLDLSTRREQQRRDDTNSALDAGQLATRLSSVCSWVKVRGIGGASRIILFGADMAASAALLTAAGTHAPLTAVVIGGSQITVSPQVLADVRVPTLVIVAGMDRAALESNRTAIRSFARPARLVRIARAGHRFSEPGALGAAAEQIVEWLDVLTGRRRSLADFTRQYRRLLLRRA